MSNSPALATSSTRRSKIAWRGRNPSTNRGVNAFDTSLRTRVVGRLHVEDPGVDQVPERVVPCRRSRPTHLFVARHVEIGPPEPPVPQERASTSAYREISQWSVASS